MMATVSGPGVIIVIIVGVLALAIYFIPTIIALSRHHRQSAAIGVLNLFLGWTVLGWLGSLIWSLTNPSNQVLVVNQYPQNNAAPGWYPDSGRMRFWSGIEWTEHYRDQ